ncbi:MAG: carboxymuconolactone decarboxylase family protein [Chitinophagaceae bacterium]|nr:carboxymuconolactone decarboxylase family protein [Chitinophagaceae bacterium]
MKTFDVPNRSSVSANNQAIFDNLQQALGFVPNLYAAIAYSATGLEKFLAFQNAKTSLSNKEKEAVNLVVSEVNGCRYCLSAHTVIGKMNGFTEEQIFDLRAGTSNDAKLRALVSLARDVVENKGKATPAILDAFFEVGYNNENLVDLVLQISDKTAMNYLHNITQVPIDFPVAEPLKRSSL